MHLVKGGMNPVFVAPKNMPFIVDISLFPPPGLQHIIDGVVLTVFGVSGRIAHPVKLGATEADECSWWWLPLDKLPEVFGHDHYISSPKGRFSSATFNFQVKSKQPMGVANIIETAAPS